MNHDAHTLLLVEDDVLRKRLFDAWLPEDFRLVWAGTAAAAVALLMEHSGRSFDGVLLDYELGTRGPSGGRPLQNGLHVARVVAGAIDPDVPVLVHSADATGGANMAALLRRAGFDVTQVPFPRLDEARFVEWLGDVRLARAEAADTDREVT